VGRRQSRRTALRIKLAKAKSLLIEFKKPFANMVVIFGWLIFATPMALLVLQPSPAPTRLVPAETGHRHLIPELTSLPPL
jgi:hypothetical protein